MPRYRFTGDSAETFPTIVLGDAYAGFTVLEAEPGGVYDLPDVVTHPRLEPVDDAAPADPEPATDPAAFDVVAADPKD